MKEPKIICKYLPTGEHDSMGHEVTKFFAVTTEFAVGDQVQRHDSIKPITIDGKVNTVEMLDDSWFKILAPISPAVTWEIPDGAEIEIELGYDKWEGFKLRERKDEPEPVTCKVKGQCGHYH